MYTNALTDLETGFPRETEAVGDRAGACSTRGAIISRGRRAERSIEPFAW
jgi:hypothetical protein